LFQQLYAWLKNHPIYNGLIVLVYFLAVVLPHDNFGAWIARVLDQPLGRDYYNLLILVLGVAVLFAYLYIIKRRLANNRSGREALNKALSKNVITYLTLTLLLITLAFHTILVVNIEIIHLVQYAILSLLLFPLTQHYFSTLIWGTVLGAIDEIYQYKVLRPTYEYYDFNDVILDLLGGALGLLLVATFQPGFNRVRRNKAIRTTYWLGGGLIVLVVLGFFFGWIIVYPVDGIAEAPFQLIRKYDPSFWTSIPPNVEYHAIKPVEGMVMIAYLLGIYKYLLSSMEKLV